MPAIKQPLLSVCLSIALLAVTSCTADDTASTEGSPPTPTDTNEVQVLDSERGSADDPAPLEPGRYAIPFLGAADNTPWGEVEVPPGWGQDRLLLATGPDLDPHLRRIELLKVTAVSTDPCTGTMESVEGGVTATVKALTKQDTVRPSEPQPVSIDGYAGQLVRFQVPGGLDIEDCWDGASLRPIQVGGSSTSVFFGWTYRLWVLDLDGDPVTILAAHGPDTTPTELAELTDMVEGLHFTEPR